MKDKITKGFLESSINLRNIREERRKEVSKDALFKSCKKKVQTTMIGALDAIEKQLGFLWGFDGQDVLTEEQKQLKEIYDEVRANILEAGTKRVRPAIMTTATTLIALLPILTSTGKGSDIMVPMAIPIFGGMLIATLTIFVVPVLYSMWQENLLKNNSIIEKEVNNEK